MVHLREYIIAFNRLIVSSVKLYHVNCALILMLKHINCVF